MNDSEISLGQNDNEEDKEETSSRRSLNTSHPSYGKLDLDVYSPDDLAIRLGCTKSFINKQIRDGKLIATKSAGPIGSRILKENVIKWLNSPED